MELLIVADLEGVSGVDRQETCDPAHPEYLHALAHYGADVATIAAAARRVGIAAVALLDWHGRSVTDEALGTDIARAVLPLTPRPRIAVLLGFHARSGQAEAFAAQTFRPGLRIRWNGREAGELALASRWLGEHGIPLVLATGDRGLTREAEEWIEQTATVAVKRATAPDRAECLPVARAQQALAEALERVLLRRSWWWVYRPERPIRWEITTAAGGSVIVEEATVAGALQRLCTVVPDVALAVPPQFAAPD